MASFNVGSKVWVRTPSGRFPGVVLSSEKHPMFSEPRYTVRWNGTVGGGWCPSTLSHRS